MRNVKCPIQSLLTASFQIWLSQIESTQLYTSLLSERPQKRSPIYSIAEKVQHSSEKFGSSWQKSLYFFSKKIFLRIYVQHSIQKCLASKLTSLDFATAEQKFSVTIFCCQNRQIFFENCQLWTRFSYIRRELPQMALIFLE